MNNVRKALGLVWILLGPAAIAFMIWQAVDKIGDANARVAQATNGAARELAASNATNTTLQWCIIIAIFLPVAFGLVIFGRYAMAGEYNKLPTSSAEL
jgi:hypothetical protein